MADKHEHKGHMTKEELQEDAFVEGAIKAADYVRHNKKSLTTLLIIVIVLAFGSRMWMAHRAEVQGQANVLLNRGTAFFSADEYEQAQSFFERVITEYPASNAAGYALYYQAMSAWRQNDYAGAEAAWRRYLEEYGDDELISAVSTAGLALWSEQHGDYGSAARLFRKAATMTSENFWASRHLFQSALCLQEAERLEEALETLEQIQEQYPESPEARDIEMYMEQIKFKMNMN